jgi:hypothetical protein
VASNADKPTYDTKDIDQMVWDMVSKKETFKSADCLKGDGPSHQIVGNIEEVVGARLKDDLNWKQRIEKHILQPQGFTFCSFLGIDHDDILLKGELTAPIVEEIEEKGEENETNWFCKGCKKYFATKASLKRHHDRKKSCKELAEKPEAEAEVKLSSVSIPDKPYIVDWVDQILQKAISGETTTEKPYCKHCDLEFANKSNLNKHLLKSIACDKLAKQEFMKLIL